MRYVQCALLRLARTCAFSDDTAAFTDERFPWKVAFVVDRAARFAAFAEAMLLWMTLRSDAVDPLPAFADVTMPWIIMRADDQVAWFCARTDARVAAVIALIDVAIEEPFADVTLMPCATTVWATSTSMLTATVAAVREGDMRKSGRGGRIRVYATGLCVARILGTFQVSAAAGSLHRIRNKFQRQAVHAIAQSRRLRPIGEHMPEMSAALAADFCSGHST